MTVLLGALCAFKMRLDKNLWYRNYERSMKMKCIREM